MSAFDTVAAQDYESLLPRPVLDPELSGSCSTRFDLDYILHLGSLLKSAHTGAAVDQSSSKSSETCPSQDTDLIQRLATELRTWSDDLRMLRDEQAGCVVQVFQHWLDIAPRSHPFRSAALCLVVKGAASSGKLPSSLFVHGVKLESRDPFFGGGFADVYRGVCEGEMVAVKKPRALSMVSNPYARLCREALIWYQLRHPFVLPFIGVDQDNFKTTNLVGLVTPWISPGTLKDVMKSDRFEVGIDPYAWLDEIAQGLAYLHEEDVVHGDLNDVNILITDEKHVQIADFGQASVAEKSGIGMTVTSTNAGSCAWMSPERATEDGHERDEADDVYSYGCLAYTLFARHRPFHTLSAQGVLLKVSMGQRPERPSSLERSTPLYDQIWSLVTLCWSQEGVERPSMKQVVPMAQGCHSPALVEREVTALLHSLSTENFDSVSDDIIAWANKAEAQTDRRTLVQVIRIVFNKAIEDATSVKTYARLCQKMMEQVSPTIQDEDITSSEDVPAAGGALFRKYLIIQCQNTLKRRHASYEAAVAAVKLANDNGLNSLTAKLKDVIEQASQFWHGPVKFVIELCTLQMFGGTEETITSEVNRLLASATEPYEVNLRLLLAGEERPDTPASGEIAHSSTPGRSAQAAKRARQKANRARKQAEYEAPPARWKPSFGRLPRSKSTEEATTPHAEGAVAFLSTEGDTEVEGADGVMSDADASKRIAEDLKELFDIRNVDEGEDYFEKLPAAHHARLVEKVISRAIESKEADAQLAADLFARAVEKELCTPDAFERGFLPIAELLDDIVIDAPKAFNLMALMLKGAGLADDEERRGRIAEKSIDADKLIALLLMSQDSHQNLCHK